MTDETGEGDALLDAKRDGEPWAQGLEADAALRGAALDLLRPVAPREVRVVMAEGEPWSQALGVERAAEAYGLPLSTLDWWAGFRDALEQQVDGDRVVTDAGYAAMLAGWTPQRFAAECATRLQESLNRRPVRAL